MGVYVAELIKASAFGTFINYIFLYKLYVYNWNFYSKEIQKCSPFLITKGEQSKHFIYELLLWQLILFTKMIRTLFKWFEIPLGDR